MCSKTSALIAAAVFLMRLGFALGQGQVLWEQNGVLVCEDYFGGGTSPLTITEDESGGAIIAWADARDAVYAQRVDSNGNCLWTTNGVEVYGPSLFPENIRSARDGSGGAIIVWEHFYGGQQGIYTGRVDSNGTVWWAVPVCVSDSAQEYPTIVSDEAGGAIVAWIDRRSGSNDIYAQRVGRDGVVRWIPGGVCIATQAQVDFPSVVADGEKGAIFAWGDSRNGNWDIYGQRADSTGVASWQSGGVPICTADSSQWDGPIAGDTRGGAIIFWVDGRGASYDIYAQGVNRDGDTLWANNGVPVCTEDSTQGGAACVGDSRSGAIIAWADKREGDWDIYAQRVDSSGTMKWAVAGVPVCAVDTTQWAIVVNSDGNGGAIIAWQDIRAGNWDIYCQRVDSSGVLKWDSGGLAVCTTPEEQFWGPVIATDDEGGAIIAWGDARLGVSVYAQRVGDVVGVEEELDPGSGKQEVRLYQNEPNPFTHMTKIRYQLVPSGVEGMSVFSHVNLSIYDISGCLVKTLADQRRKPGEHRVVWDGRNCEGEAVPAGIYFSRLKSAGVVDTRKIVFIK